MRFIYADPGFRSTIGHHSNQARLIVRELRARGIATTVLAFADADPALHADLGLIPFFRAYTYWVRDDDPISGWLNAFQAASDLTRQDLARLSDLNSDDILYMSSAQGAQLMGVAAWMAAQPAKRLPTVLMDFVGNPGLDVETDDAGAARYVVRDPRIDPRALLLHVAGAEIKRLGVRINLTTVDATTAAAYASLIDHPVVAVPFHTPALSPLARRAGRRPITISVLGHQRHEKGYHFMPAVAAQILAANEAVRILAHNSAPEQMSETQNAMRALAAREPRLVLDERAVDFAGWTAFIDQTDLMLCPYLPETYAINPSGILAVALANAIPVVAGAGSTIARSLHAFGDPCAIFERAEPAAIAQAVQRALDDFDMLAERAYDAALVWQKTQGPAAYVDALLSVAGKIPASVPAQ